MEDDIMKSEDIYKNRAAIDHNDAAYDCTDCECCEEELVFAMKDNYHEFSIGLSTVLHCLAIAQQEGYIPTIPSEWWNALRQV
jgi:hypothetical protein